MYAPVPEKILRQSVLNASVGSTLAARRAGMYAASAAATVNAHATPAKVAGSAGDSEQQRMNPSVRRQGAGQTGGQANRGQEHALADDEPDHS